MPQTAKQVNKGLRSEFGAACKQHFGQRAACWMGKPVARMTDAEIRDAIPVLHGLIALRYFQQKRRAR